MTYKYTAISLLMIIVVGLATWTTFLSYRPESKKVANIPARPDAFMEDVTALIMDKQGKPNMKIVTPKMVHYLENDMTHLLSPT